MKDTPPHLKTLAEIEREGIPGLVEVLREGGTDGVRYALWNATGWHRDYSPPAWRNRATAEQKRIGWEMAVRIEKTICKALHEAHERQAEGVMETLDEGPEGFANLLDDIGRSSRSPSLNGQFSAHLSLLVDRTRSGHRHSSAGQIVARVAE